MEAIANLTEFIGQLQEKNPSRQILPVGRNHSSSCQDATTKGDRLAYARLIEQNAKGFA